MLLLFTLFLIIFFVSRCMFFFFCARLPFSSGFCISKILVTRRVFLFLFYFLICSKIALVLIVVFFAIENGGAFVMLCSCLCFCFVDICWHGWRMMVLSTVVKENGRQIHRVCIDIISMPSRIYQLVWKSLQGNMCENYDPGWSAPMAGASPLIKVANRHRASH